MSDRTVNVDQPDPAQIEIFRRMSGGERLAVAAGLLRAVRRMLRVHLAEEHPDWDQDRIEREVSRRIAGGNR